MAKILTSILVFLLIVNSLASDRAVDKDEIVKKACAEKLNFLTINQFDTFLNLYKAALEGDAKLFDGESSMKRCLDDKDAILDLGELVQNYDKIRPCKYREISKLEDYAFKYYSTGKKPLGMKFFTLFGVNIGFYCQLNLLAHIRQADDEVDQTDFIYAVAAPTGWKVLLNEYTKKSMKFGSSTYANSQLINKVAKLVPGLTQVDQFVYEIFQTSVDQNNRGIIEASHYDLTDAKRANHVVESLNESIRSCRNLDQFYVNLILSLGKLNHLGLLVNFEEFNWLHEHSLSLHKWLAATSFCQLMARVEVSLDESKQSDSLLVKVIHDERKLESRTSLYSYVSAFDEISREAADNAWAASVSDSKWRAAIKSGERLGSSGQSRLSEPMRKVQQFIRGIERDFE